MRTAVIAIIPLIAAFLGYILSIKYGESSDFWDNFSFWHKKIKSEISFSQNSLPEIFGGENKSDVFLTVATEYLKTKNVTLKLRFLSKEEKDFLTKYLQALGTTDRNSQLNFLNSVETELEKYRSDAENKRKRYRPLFVKLGFLFGLIVFILII